MEEFISLKNRTTPLTVNPDGEAVLFVVNGVPFVKTASAVVGLKTTATANGTPTAPVAFTQTYATADATFSAYTPDAQTSAYVGADVTALKAETNLLRLAYENLRAHCEDQGKLINSLIDALQAQGIVA